MISIKSEREISLMKKAGHLNYLTHEEVKKHLKEGITTKELDKIAYNFIIQNDSVPSFLNYEGYPASICTSINEEIVHGIPGNRRLRNGDIISVDIGVCYKGYHSDAARTYLIGDCSQEVKNLVFATKESLYEGLQVIKEGAKIGDIGAAITSVALKNNLSIVKELVGHGVGTQIQEDPNIPNYGKENTGLTLKQGMVIAVEPMLNLGKRQIEINDDGWTITTKDGKPSAHFEHTVLVTKNGYEILTGE